MFFTVKKITRHASSTSTADMPARVIALAGNPNVGKSTVFNWLTGMKQHTGNWAGKTVANAHGTALCGDTAYTLVDIPGTYSLLAHSAEEAVARDFICFKHPDATVVVCDATCLERNLNLALQITEITPNVVVCVNMLDDAAKKQIYIDLQKLSQNLGVPVVGTNARKGRGVTQLLETLHSFLDDQKSTPAPSVPPIRYTPALEAAIAQLQPLIATHLGSQVSSRWLALRLLENDESMLASISMFLRYSPQRTPILWQAVLSARAQLVAEGIDVQHLQDLIVSCLVLRAEEVCLDCVFAKSCKYSGRDRRIDRFLTSRATGIPLMLLLLCLVFWITMVGANYPSALLSQFFNWGEGQLLQLFAALHAPSWLQEMLVLGVYKVLAWVVAVMLPPMAIFFPLFTLLEDCGYLPRIAFNLDKYFRKCHACGKQALTMCMGKKKYAKASLLWHKALLLI